MDWLPDGLTSKRSKQEVKFLFASNISRAGNRGIGYFLAAMCCCLFSQAEAAEAVCQPVWPAWQSFKAQFINEGGRVVDSNTTRKQTVSEGQAYALFFALVANDQKSFDKILDWTENNLADGDLTSHLPAWLWGHKDDGSWGVLDSNSASDADLWMVYALGEAGRLWGNRRYVALSSLLANRIVREETADLPGLGITLLPAPKGFKTGENAWRLNPSYLPMQIMDWLTNRSSDPVWQKISQSSLRILLESAPNGFAPDWTVYESPKGFGVDQHGEGGYNAIRVYLWAGMLAQDAPEQAPLLAVFTPMIHFVEQHGYPPESVNILTGAANKPGSPGFSAALLPFLQASDDTVILHGQLDRLTAHPPHPDAYYDQVLTLFALGWREGYFHFSQDGSLLPNWSESCNLAPLKLPPH